MSRAANALNLVAVGTINQTAGSISAITLTGSADSANLAGQATNLIGTLGAFTTTEGFVLNDNQSLTVTGPVVDNGSDTAIELTTVSGDITLAGNISAVNQVSLFSAGTMSQTGGSIVAAQLYGTSQGSTSLTGGSSNLSSNMIDGLSGFSVTTGSFTLDDGESLQVFGNVSVLAGDVVLRAAGVGNAINIYSQVSASATGTVSVRADGYSASGEGAYHIQRGF